MARYRVYEMRGSTGKQTKVYEGAVAPEILEGRESLQVRAFGRRYYISGRVFRDTGGQVRGVLCRFEEVA